MEIHQLVIKASNLDLATALVAAEMDPEMYESATVTLTLRPKGYARYKEIRRQLRVEARRARELQRLQMGQQKMAENLGIPVQAFLDAHAAPGGPDLPFDTGNPDLRPGAVNTLGSAPERVDITPKGRKAIGRVTISDFKDFWSSGHAG